MYASKQFEFRKDKSLYNKIKQEIINGVLTPSKSIKEHNMGLSLMISRIEDQDTTLSKKQLLMRQSAWCLLLGININSEEYANFESMFNDILFNFNPESKEEQDTLRQIELDVYRTFRSYNLKFLNAKVDSG